MADLAARQTELVAALTGVGPLPAGFAGDRLEVARRALLRKRSGDVAVAWPALAAGLGSSFASRFSDWAAHRPTGGSLRDGWDFAHHLAARCELTPAARRELARHRAARRDRGGRLHRRSGLGVRRIDGFWTVRIGRRVIVAGR